MHVNVFIELLAKSDFLQLSDYFVHVNALTAPNGYGPDVFYRQKSSWSIFLQLTPPMITSHCQRLIPYKESDKDM